MSIVKKVLGAVFNTALLLVLLASSATVYESYMYEYVGSSVVMLTDGRGGGTGFQVTAPSGKNFILTNAHICRIAPTLMATRQDGSVSLTQVIEIDSVHDLCIMTPVEGLRPLKIANTIKLHERVWLIGHPGLRPLTLESGHFAGNMDIQVSTSCSQAELDAELDRLSKLSERDWTMEEVEKFFLLLSGYCVKPFVAQYINNISYGGNSGSPVVDKYGNVVGVLFAGSRSQPTSSFTVPLQYVHSFLKNK